MEFKTDVFIKNNTQGVDKLATSDAAGKLSWKDKVSGSVPVDVYTDVPLSNSPDYTAGTNTTYAGLGATLRATVLGAFPTYQGITPFVGMTVLVMSEVDPKRNGVYVLTAVGNSTTTFYNLERKYYTSADLSQMLVYAAAGTGAGTGFVQIQKPTNAGLGITEGLTFIKIKGDSQAVASIVETGIIYVDDVAGVDAPNRGGVSNPYQSVDYVLNNISVTGAFTYTSTANSDVLTTATTTNLRVGQYVTGLGIPFGTIVLGFTSNTVSLSNPATSNNVGASGKWWKPVTIKVSGYSQTATQSWWRLGVNFAENSNIHVYYGDFIMYNVNEDVVIPYENLGRFNYTSKATTSSVFLKNSSNLTLNSSFKFYFGKTVSHANDTLIKWSYGTNVSIEGRYIHAPQGSVATITDIPSLSNVRFSIDGAYGATGGVTAVVNINGNPTWTGNIETPLGVNALVSSGLSFRGTKVVGVTDYDGGSYALDIDADISGSSARFTNCFVKGNVSSALVELNGNCDFYATTMVTFFKSINGGNRVHKAPVASGGISSNNSSSMDFYGVGVSTNPLLINDTSSITINGNTTIQDQVTVGATGNLLIKGKLKANNILVNGTLSVSGEMLQDAVSGLAAISMASGSKVLVDGKIIASNSSQTVPLILKDGGELIFNPNSYLKVINSKPPIKCTANTDDSKKISCFWLKTNCDGDTYSVFLAFDVSSFAPVDSIGGFVFENTNF